jgi:AcrR family transcriptional regulator
MPYVATTPKGIATREAIVEHAITLVRSGGFEGLSIGNVAQASAMSKSGVFAHFGSREDLQLAVLDTVAEDFAQRVLAPAFRQPRGLQRLRAIFSGWIAWSSGAGCPMIVAAIEYDDRPGAIRDRVVHWHRRLREALARAVALAIEAGELRADTDPAQVAFEMFGMIMALHHDSRLFVDRNAVARATRALDRLLADRAT